MKRHFVLVFRIVIMMFMLIILAGSGCEERSENSEVDRIQNALLEYEERGIFSVFELRDINQDGIPEVILGRNDGHPDGLCVAALVDNGLVQNESIGSFGRIAFHSGSQVLTAVYGNHGCFNTFIFRLKRGRLCRSPIVLCEDAHTDDVHWYIDVATGLIQEDNSYDTLFNYELSRAVELTEKENSEIRETLLGESEVLVCSEMVELTRENIIRECQKWR